MQGAYFGLGLNTYKTSNIPVSLSCTLCLLLTSKCWHANTLTKMVDIVNIIPVLTSAHYVLTVEGAKDIWRR